MSIPANHDSKCLHRPLNDVGEAKSRLPASAFPLSHSGNDGSPESVRHMNCQNSVGETCHSMTRKGRLSLAEVSLRNEAMHYDRLR